MARSIWGGTIAFGLVNINVNLVTAVRDHDVHFHHLSRVTGNRVRQERKDAVTGEVVPYEDIVKGAEVAPSTYVTVTAEDLVALAPDATKRVDVQRFVGENQIPPIYLDQHWYAVAEPNSEQAYALFIEALRKTRKIAIGEFVMRSRSYPVAIYPYADALVVSALAWADEIVPPESVAPPTACECDPRHVRQAVSLVEALTDPGWSPAQLEDAYTLKVKELIAARAEGAVPVYTPSVERPRLTDLMEALEQSIAVAQQRRHEAS